MKKRASLYRAETKKRPQPGSSLFKQGRKKISKKGHYYGRGALKKNNNTERFVKGKRTGVDGRKLFCSRLPCERYQEHRTVKKAEVFTKQFPKCRPV